MNFFRWLKTCAFRVFVRLFAQELTRNLFEGLLRRQADLEELDICSRALRREADLVGAMVALTNSPEHRDCQIMLHAGYFVEEGYQGILGRMPDEIGGRVYRELLEKGHGRLSYVLQQLAHSDEHWNIQIRSNAKPIIQLVYHGMFGRSPDEGAAGYVRLLQEDAASLSAIVHALVCSSELWHLKIRFHADELVQSSYAALLGKMPGAVASSYVDALRDGSLMFVDVLSQIASLPENLDRQVQLNASSIVNKVYQGLFGRDPDEAGGQFYRDVLQNHPDEFILFVKKLAESEEFWQQQVKANADRLWERVVGGMGASTFVDVEQTAILKNTLAEGLLLEFMDQLIQCMAGWHVLANHCAEEIVEQAYQGVLGRSADKMGFEHHVQVFKNNTRLDQLIIALHASKEFESKHIRELAYKLEDLWEKIDRAGVSFDHTVRQDIFLASDFTSLVNLILYAFLPDLKQVLDYRSRYPGISYQSTTLPRLESTRRLALVFIPSETWLAFSLAIADDLHHTYGCETVLVWDQWSPSISYACSINPHVYETISLAEFQRFQEKNNFCPAFIVSHSFGWLRQTKELLRRFPASSFFVYGDGYKNEVSDTLRGDRYISGAYFFGYQPEARRVKAHKVFPPEVVNHYLDKISEIYNYQLNITSSFGDYAVVYLRYWGTGPYAFSLDEVAEIMLNTIQRGVGSVKKLVIKKDGRAHPELFEILKDRLCQEGYFVSDLEDYLVACGIGPSHHMLSVENLLAHGLLIDAATHVVFDSSLSYLIASSSHIKKKFDVVIGADLSSLFEFKDIAEVTSFNAVSVDAQLLQEQGIAPRSLDAGVKGLIRYSRQYAQSVLSSIRGTALQETDDCAFFRITVSEKYMIKDAFV